MEAKVSRFSLKNLKGDRVIWFLILVFAMISIAVVYSSTSALAYRSNTSPFRFMFMQLLFYIIGFGILLLCYKIPLGWYRKLSFLLLILSGGLLLIPLAVGELRTFDLFGISIQPSEFAKISVIIYLARVLETSEFETFKEFLLKIFIPVGCIIVLCLAGSASVAMIITFMTFIILITAGIKWKHILYSIPLILGGIGIILVLHHTTGMFSRISTVESRIERFLNDDESKMTEKELAERAEKNFQSEQAKQAIQLGGITGRGPGNSIKRDILPNAYDDYIYSIIVEEYGLVGGFIVLILYISFFQRCIVISRMCKREFSTIVVLGLSMLIMLQAILHIFVNVGIFPVTGQTLPMISRGGSSLVIMSSAFGIILSVNRTIVISENKKKKEREKLEKPEMDHSDNL